MPEATRAPAGHGAGAAPPRSQRRAASGRGSREARSTSTMSNGRATIAPPRPGVPAPAARCGRSGRQDPSPPRSRPWLAALRATGSTTSRLAPGDRGERRPPSDWGAAKARSRRKRVPRPSRLATPIVPPMAAVRRCAIISPSPLPPNRRGVSASACAKAVNSRRRAARRDAGAGILDLESNSPTRPRARGPGRPAASHGLPS